MLTTIGTHPSSSVKPIFHTCYATHDDKGLISTSPVGTFGLIPFFSTATLFKKKNNSCNWKPWNINSTVRYIFDMQECWNVATLK